MPISINADRAVSRNRIIRQLERIEMLKDIIDDAGLLAVLQVDLAAAGLPTDFDAVIPQITEKEYLTEALWLHMDAFMHVHGLYGGTGLGVQDLAELKALVSTDIPDRQVRLVEDLGVTYRYDTASIVDPSSDPDCEIPDDLTHPAPGRWFLVELDEADEISFDPANTSYVGTDVQAVLEESGDTNHPPVDTLVELSAIPAAKRAPMMMVLCRANQYGQAVIFRYDETDTTDVFTKEGYIIPDDVTHPAPGRWIQTNFVSPFTAVGDIIYAIGTPLGFIPAQLGIQPAGNILRSNGTNPLWDKPNSLASDDQDMNPTGNSTGTDDFDTGITITNTPDRMVAVFVNGVKYVLGDGDATKDCYFSSDGTVGGLRAVADIAANDHLMWNPTKAGFDILTTDTVELLYEWFM